MTTLPPEPPDDRHVDPNVGSDHEPTVNFDHDTGSAPTGAEPTAPLPPPYGSYAPPSGAYPPPADGYGPAAGGYSYAPQPGAPFGIDPRTGLPYSEKSKLVAGLLQILLPLGIGRMYTGHVGLGVAQLLVTVLTCGIGAVWPFIDGIITLATDSRDSQGRPLRS